MFREEVINTKLADVLSEFGLNALPEIVDMTTGSKKYPDVSILVEGVKVIIEGRKETYQKVKLMEDARRRIEEDIADVSIALLYAKRVEESETTEELIKFLKNCQYDGTVFYYDNRNIKEEEFSSIPIEELSQILHKVTTLIGSKEKLSEYVKEVKEEFVNASKILASTNLFYSNEKLLEIIKDLLEIENLSVSKKQEKDLYQMLLFILFDAILMHETISNITPQIKGLSNASSPLKDFFINEWEKILQIDYEPVFSLAYQVMKNLPTSPEIEQALGTLKQLAIKILSSGILRRHDFLGRLYHKILLKTTGSFYATYYTAIPSAILLSGLLFNTYNKDWKFGDLQDLDDFKVIDPACGSGTLLSASYTALMDLYSRSLKPSEFGKFHRKVIENCFSGWDVLDYASHLTLTTLAMHNPKTLVNKSNIYTLPNGVEDGTVYLGSLSYLSNLKKMVLFGKSWVQQGTDAKRSVKIEEAPDTFNVVIMNPPFTRSANPNVKFGYSSDIVKAKQNKELAKIIKQFNLEGIGQAGLGALFIYLGHKLLKDKGRMGIVIPRAILSGVSWEKIRRLLMNNYEIKYIISNHDAGNKDKGIEPWNWSENTHLGEVMLIVEKNSNKDKETTYINLWNKPANEMESYLLVAQIIKKSQNLSDYLTDGIYKVLEISGKEVGSFYKIKQEELKNYGWLAACVFANPSLNKLAIHVADWIKKYSKTTLSHLAISLGVDIKQIKDNFEVTTTPTKYKIVWGHQGTMNTMQLHPNFVGYGVSKKKPSESLFASKSADLLIADRPHTSNDCLLCMEAPENVLATAFWEIKLQENKYKPIILLWFNSTYGIVTLLSHSDSSMGEIFKLKKAHLEQLLIPLPDNKLLDNVKNLYNQIKTQLFKPFPEEFMLAANGQGTRKMIDDFFRDNFGLPDLTLYYPMLAQEPILTLKILPEESIIPAYNMKRIKPKEKTLSFKDEEE